MVNRLSSAYVLPTPAAAKLIGFLNLLFGGLMLLVGSAMLSLTLLQAAIATVEVNPRGVAVKAETHPLTGPKLATAKPGEPARSKPSVASGVLLGSKHWGGWRHWLNLADHASGILLNVAMMVSGYGLVRLRWWGWRLGVWTAGLKIARLAFLGGVTLLLIVPAESRESRMAWEAEARRTGLGSKAFEEGRAQVVEEAKIVATLQAVMILGFAVSGMVYPIVGLVVLNRKGVKGACLAASQEAAKRAAQGMAAQ